MGATVRRLAGSAAALGVFGLSRATVVLALSRGAAFRYLPFQRNSALELVKVPLNIKDRATEQSACELAGLTGENVTTAVRRAAGERLQRVRRERAAGSLATELLEIERRCAALPDLDRRTPDEILGYDEHGLPS
jgi:antitoxin VapB